MPTTTTIATTTIAQVNKTLRVLDLSENRISEPFIVAEALRTNGTLEQLLLWGNPIKGADGGDFPPAVVMVEEKPSAAARRRLVADGFGGSADAGVGGRARGGGGSGCGWIVFVLLVDVDAGVLFLFSTHQSSVLFVVYANRRCVCVSKTS